MPHVALHLLLATRTIADGTRNGFDLDPSLDLERPSVRNAFLHGAIGPDMGFFPGGEDLLSQAAHLVRSGDLVRRLLSTAASAQQTAFSFGWLTHMLGDVLIHPIINRAATELLDRERTAATAAWHRNAHIRVELGLDALFVARVRALRRIRLRDALDQSSARWMADAFLAVHGVQFDTRAILGSHHQVVRYHRPLMLLERFIAIGRGPGHPLRRLMRRILNASHRLAERRLGPHSSAAGFLNTIRPSRQLVREVDAVLARFTDSFADFGRQVLESGVNHDLDTGLAEDAGQPAPDAIRLLRRLEMLRQQQAARAMTAASA